MGNMSTAIQGSADDAAGPPLLEYSISDRGNDIPLITFPNSSIKLYGLPKQATDLGFPAIEKFIPIDLTLITQAGLNPVALGLFTIDERDQSSKLIRDSIVGFGVMPDDADGYPQTVLLALTKGNRVICSANYILGTPFDSLQAEIAGLKSSFSRPELDVVLSRPQFVFQIPIHPVKYTFKMCVVRK